ncbi:hypothetical protein MMC17_003666 [Xylographa soralifera]|nr:hypothetical protein [Xylographa soralifera]
MTTRHAVSHCLDTISDEDEDEAFNPYQSFFIRTTTRNATVNANGTKHTLRPDIDNPDFLRLITSIDALYSQQDVLAMQQLDGSAREEIGFGASFQVSSVHTESSKPSEVMAEETMQHTQKVILKRTSRMLYEADEKTHDNDTRLAAVSFLMEVRILSHPEIRAHPNVVRLLGIGWEYSRTDQSFPEPNLVLEQAFNTLHDFHNSNLPFETRHAICLDVAEGMKILHQCGIIHGDIKTENILMFESSRWIAKVADFSHSTLDTGEERKLPGGTGRYAAPEWQQTLKTSAMFQTDLYSYGILFGSVMVGKDVVQVFLDQAIHGRTPNERYMYLQEMKQCERFRESVLEMVYDLNDASLTNHRDNITAIQNVLACTLQQDPECRSLDKVISLLTGNAHRNTLHPNERESVISRTDTNILAIPYQSLTSMSDILKTKIFRALERLAAQKFDERSTAACYELCVCYLSGFGVGTSELCASEWLIEACRRNEPQEPWARSIAYHLLDAMNLLDQCQCSQKELETWSLEAAKRGSWMALESLRKMSSSTYLLALAEHRLALSRAIGSNHVHASVSLSDVVEQDETDVLQLHSSALIGRESDFSIDALDDHMSSKGLSEILDRRDFNGDTAMICACRASHPKIIHKLLDLAADARAINRQGESCLHLLPCLGEDDVESVASRLVERGADLTLEAQDISIVGGYETYFFVAGCPMTRAIIMNRPTILEILLRLEDKQSKEDSARATKIQLSNLRKMIALACRLNSIDALKLIAKYRPRVVNANTLKGIGYWINGKRFSLPALAIAGCVSEKTTSGFDIPGRFWRYLSNGKNHTKCVRSTIEYLSSNGMDFYSTPCGGSINALFFAIRNGQDDIVEYLLGYKNAFAPFEPFGIAHLAATENAPVAKPLQLEGSYPNHRHKMGLVSAIKVAISQGHIRIFKMLLQWQNSEALDWGETIPLMVDYKSTAWRSREGLCEYFPTDLWTKLGEDDFVEFRRREERPWIYKLNEFYGTNYRSYPPDVARYHWKPLRKKNTDYCDGRLNYGLLYMSYIATAQHRDIKFALEPLFVENSGSQDLTSCRYTLLEELKHKGINDHHQWVARNRLEQLSFSTVALAPLATAATLGWKQMVRLLLDHGADPRAQWPSGSHFYSDLHIPYRLRTDIITIIDDLLYAAKDSERRKLEGALLLLTLTNEVPNLMRPNVAQELRAMISTSASMPGDLVCEELWHALLVNSKLLIPGHRASEVHRLVFAAIDSRNVVCLQYLLRAHCNPNGPYSSWFAATPLDKLLLYLRIANRIRFTTTTPYQVKTTEEEQQRQAEAEEDVRRLNQCREVLEQHGARRGPFFILEFQLLSTILLFIFIVGLIPSIYFSFLLVNRWYLGHFVAQARRIQNGSSSTEQFFITFGAVAAFLVYLFPLSILLALCFIIGTIIVRVIEGIAKVRVIQKLPEERDMKWARMLDVLDTTSGIFCFFLFPLAFLVSGHIRGHFDGRTDRYKNRRRECSVSNLWHLMYGPTLSLVKYCQDF